MNSKLISPLTAILGRRLPAALRKKLQFRGKERAEYKSPQKQPGPFCAMNLGKVKRKIWRGGLLTAAAWVCFTGVGGRLDAADPLRVREVEPLLDGEKGPGAKVRFERTAAEGGGAPVFKPVVTARIRSEKDVGSKAFTVKAYFWGPYERPLGVSVPEMARRKNATAYALPPILKGKEETDVYFSIPDTVLALKDWKCAVVFGSANGYVVQTWPRHVKWKDLAFPEKDLIGRFSGLDQTAAVVDPVTEHVIRTGNPDQPQITLFVSLPPGVAKPSEARGVLAMCLLANSVEGVKQQLQALEEPNDVSGVLRFAASEKLIIICWGSRQLWDPRKNWDELSSADRRKADRTFDEVARAWERGVDGLAESMGFKARNMLLWGSSGSAQYAMRLALRRPDRFLAVHAHIPSSFDKPVPEGRSIMWLLTTGEMEPGYMRSRNFYQECRKMGYPIIYKPLPNTGHEGHAGAARLGLEFFRHALMVAEKEKTDENGAVARLVALDGFIRPVAWGDFLNHDVYPADQAAEVPESLRVPLPTPEIAKLWGSIR